MNSQRSIILILFLALLLCLPACKPRVKKKSEYRKFIEQQQEVDGTEDYEEEDDDDDDTKEPLAGGEVCPGVTQDDIDRVEGEMKNLQGELVMLDSADMKVLTCSRSKMKLK